MDWFVVGVVLAVAVADGHWPQPRADRIVRVAPEIDLDALDEAIRAANAADPARDRFPTPDWIAESHTDPIEGALCEALTGPRVAPEDSLTIRCGSVTYGPLTWQRADFDGAIRSSVGWIP